MGKLSDQDILDCIKYEEDALEYKNKQKMKIGVIYNVKTLSDELDKRRLRIKHLKNKKK